MSNPENARTIQAITRATRERKILFVCPRYEYMLRQAEELGFPETVQFIAPGHGSIHGQGFNEIWVDADCYRHDESGKLAEYIDFLRTRLNRHGRMRFLT